MRNFIHSIILLSLILVSSPNGFGQNRVSLLANRKEALNAREQLILNEKKELRISTYLFHLDEFGKKEVALIVDAARRGVEVTLVVDGVGKNRGDSSASFVNSVEILDILESEGVEVKVYHPRFRNMLNINNRSHIKSLIGSNSFITGDRNYASGYFYRSTEKAYISTEILVTGDEVKKAQNSFDALVKLKGTKDLFKPQVSRKKVPELRKEVNRWIRSAKSSSTKNTRDIKSYSVEHIDYIDDVADKKAKGVHLELLEMINKAKNKIEIVNPYILLTKEFKSAINGARSRGVDVSILTNSEDTNNVEVMGKAWSIEREGLIKNGVEVFETNLGKFVHAKSMIVDDEKVYIGSFNLDPRSQKLNLEGGVILESKDFAQRLARYNRGVRIRLTKKIGLGDLVKQRFCDKILIKLLSPIL